MASVVQLRHPSAPGLAYDPNTGVLYGLDGESENVYRIDPATAAAAAPDTTVRPRFAG